MQPVYGSVTRYKFAVPLAVAENAMGQKSLGTVLASSSKNTADVHINLAKASFKPFSELMETARITSVPIEHMTAQLRRQWDIFNQCCVRGNVYAWNNESFPCDWERAQCVPFAALWKRRCATPRSIDTPASLWVPVQHYLWVCKRKGVDQWFSFVLIQKDPILDTPHTFAFFIYPGTLNCSFNYHLFLIFMVETVMPFDGSGVEFSARLHRLQWSPQLEFGLLLRHSSQGPESDQTTARIVALFNSWVQMCRRKTEDPFQVWWMNHVDEASSSASSSQGAKRGRDDGLSQQLHRNVAIPKMHVDMRRWVDLPDARSLQTLDDWLYTGRCATHEQLDHRLSREQDEREVHMSLTATIALSMSGQSLRPLPPSEPIANALDEKGYSAESSVTVAVPLQLRGGYNWLPGYQFRIRINGAQQVVTPTNLPHPPKNLFQTWFDLNLDAMAGGAQEMQLQVKLVQSRSTIRTPDLDFSENDAVRQSCMSFAELVLPSVAPNRMEETERLASVLTGKSTLDNAILIAEKWVTVFTGTFDAWIGLDSIGTQPFAPSEQCHPRMGVESTLKQLSINRYELTLQTRDVAYPGMATLRRLLIKPRCVLDTFRAAHWAETLANQQHSTRRMDDFFLEMTPACCDVASMLLDAIYIGSGEVVDRPFADFFCASRRLTVRVDDEDIVAFDVGDLESELATDVLRHIATILRDIGDAMETHIIARDARSMSASCGNAHFHSEVVGSDIVATYEMTVA